MSFSSLLRRLVSVIVVAFLLVFSALAQEKSASPATPKNPVLELQEMVNKSLAEAKAYLDTWKSYAQADAVFGYTDPKSRGEAIWTPDPPPERRNYTLEGYQEAVDKANMSVKSWQEGKGSSEQAISDLSNAAIFICDDCYKCDKRYRSYMFNNLALWVKHETDLESQELRKEESDAATAAGGQLNYEQKRALTRKQAEGYNASQRRLTDAVLGQLAEMNDREDKARKEWGPELWSYIDFGKKKSASPRDAFAYLSGLGTGCLDDFQSSVEPPRGGAVYDSKPLLFECDPDRDSLSPQLASWANNVVNPDLQPFPDPKLWSVGFTLKPSVDGLRNYHYSAEPWEISQAVYLRVIDPVSKAPQWGRVKPIKDGDNDKYTIMVSGRKLPLKRSELTDLKSDDPSIHLEPAGFMEEKQRRAMPADNWNLWGDALSRVRSGMTPEKAQDFDAMPSLLLDVKIAPGVLPGYKTFSINGAKGGFFLDQGTTKASISFTHMVTDHPDGTPDPNEPEMQFDRISKAVIGSYIYVEIQAQNPVPTDAIRVVLGRDGLRTSIDGRFETLAKKVAGKPGLYRTDKIRIVEDGDPVLDPTSKRRKPETLYLPVDFGSSLECAPSDPRAFVYQNTVASLRVLPPPPESLWLNALTRAAAADNIAIKLDGSQSVPDATVEQIETTIITQAIFRYHLDWVIFGGAYAGLLHYWHGGDLTKGDIVVNSKISLYEHAAMIVMRDHFVEMTNEYLGQLSTLTTRQQRVAFILQLAANTSCPPLGVKVPMAPPGVMWDDLTGVCTMASLAEPEWNDQSSYQKIRDDAAATAFPYYYAQVKAARDHAANTPDKAMDDLLAVTGNGFGNVVEDLKPYLVKPVVDSATGDVQWAPDRMAVARVSTLSTKFDEIRAQQKYGAIDSQVAIALASLVPVALPGGLMKTAMMVAFDAFTLGQTVASQIPEYMESHDELEFATGAMPILGAERYNVASLQATPAWSIVLNLLLAPVGMASGSAEIFKDLGLISKQQALRKALALAQKINKTGAQAIEKATPEQVASFIACAAGAEQRVGAATKVISAEEAEIETALLAVRDEVKKKVPIAQEVIPDKELPKVVAEAPGPGASKVQKYEIEYDNPGAPAEAVIPNSPRSPSNPRSPPSLERPGPSGRTDFPTLDGVEPKIPTADTIDPLATIDATDAELLNPPVDPNPCPPLVPQENQPWPVADSVEPLQLGRKLSDENNKVCEVFLLGAAGEGSTKVVKVVRETRNFDEVRSTWKSIRVAREAVETFKIPHLKILKLVDSEIGGYLIQEFMPTVVEPGKESFQLSRFLNMTTEEAANFQGLRKAADGKYIPTPEMQDAILGLVAKMKKAELWFEDFKPDNIYLRRLRSGQLECGVMDVDRIAQFGKFTEKMQTIQEGYERMPWYLRVRSVTPAPRGTPGVGLTLDQLWSVVMERQGMVTWEPGGGFSSGTLDIGKCEKVIPSLGRTAPINLGPNPPAPPPMLLIVSGEDLPRVGYAFAA